MRRWVICFSHSRTCSAVTRSIWFQKFCEDNAAGLVGRRRVKTVCRYQSANCSLLVGETARFDGGQEQVLPDGEALVTLGREDGIEQLDQVQTLSDVEQGGRISESGHLRFEGLRRPVGEFGGGDEIVDFAEVDLADDLVGAVRLSQ